MIGLIGKLYKGEMSIDGKVKLIVSIVATTLKTLRMNTIGKNVWYEGLKEEFKATSTYYIELRKT